MVTFSRSSLRAKEFKFAVFVQVLVILPSTHLGTLQKAMQLSNPPLFDGGHQLPAAINSEKRFEVLG